MPDGGHELASLRSELAGQRRRIVALERIVAQLAHRQAVAPDSRLGPLLAMIYAFAKSTDWSIGGLLAETRRNDPALWCQLDVIAGQKDDGAAIRIGLWLAKHVGHEAEGYRLEDAGRRDEVRLYRVVPVVTTGNYPP